jgi:hypothetical protein
LTDTHQSAGAQGAQTATHAQAGGQAPPTEEELRAAYEAELDRIGAAEIVLQTAVSLLNVGGRRLGLAAGAQGARDLEQVRDAIDGVRGLMPVLERRMPSELRPLRDALAQLQMAYAREAGAQPPDAREAAPPAEAAGSSEGMASEGGAPGGGTPEGPAQKPAEQPPAPGARKGPGPAEASGRLWVPGR